MNVSAAKTVQGRSEPRDEVYARLRARLADRSSIALVVVNVSPHGLMARTEATMAPGDRLTIALPGFGQVDATVRWSLGGRIGCQLDRAIEAIRYRSLVAALGG